MQSPFSAAVSTAANLGRCVRQVSDVVYYLPPIFKDEEFESDGMACLNLICEYGGLGSTCLSKLIPVADMIDSSLHTKQEDHGRERAVLQSGKEAQSEALVRVFSFPGMVAYRKGGSELGKQQLR
jgi:hypothetical protein